MRHMRNAMIRSIYILLLFVILNYIFNLFELKKDFTFYGGFFVLCIFYYILDLLNFEVQKYRLNNLIISGFLLSFGGVIYYVFRNDMGYIRALATFYIIQNIIRWTLIYIVKKDIRIAIIGCTVENQSMIQHLKSNDKYEYMGCFGNPHKDNKKDTFWDINYIDEIVREKKINKLIVEEKNLPEIIVKKILNLKLDGVKIVDRLTFNQEVEGKIDVKQIDDRWLLYDHGFNIFYNNIQKRIKRLFDIICTFIISIPAIPIMIVSAIIIKCESKGPVFFKQTRIGLNNQPFEMFKFRSMKLHDPNEHSKYAGENDDRITKYGKFMRKTRIDELPQLWNVLKGDMSFVGPRAEWDELCYSYMDNIPHYNIRHSVQPGLTGWAQVMYPYGAGIEDAQRKLEYDLYYIKYQSFVMDILIFFKTVKTVVFGQGR